LQSIIKRFTARPFVRNVATVATGTAASQAIIMAFAPLITRLYGPEAYGLQGIFMLVVGLLTTVVALGYPTAIVLPRADSDALGIARLSVYIGVAITLAVTLLIALFGNELLELLNAQAIAPFLFLIPVAMIISVLGVVLGQWLIRKKAFKVTATYGVATTFVVNSIKTIAGVVNPSALMLIATNTFGGLLSTVLTYWGWRRVAKPARVQEKSAHEPRRPLWELAKKHSDFPILRTPQNLINAFSKSLPVLLLASFFGAASAGQYTIALAVLGLPSGLIAGSVMSVFYPKITEAIDNGKDAKALIIKATLGMAATGALPFLIVLLAGPFLFTFVFGEAWRTAGIYAQLLAPWLLFQYINKPAVSAVPALRLQAGLLIYELFSTGTKLLALWLGFFIFEDDLIAVALFSGFGVIAYLWLIGWVIFRSGHSHSIFYGSSHAE
jgi:O-antigen/teichoic acid export membrane protein